MKITIISKQQDYSISESSKHIGLYRKIVMVKTREKKETKQQRRGFRNKKYKMRGNAFETSVWYDFVDALFHNKFHSFYMFDFRATMIKAMHKPHVLTWVETEMYNTEY